MDGIRATPYQRPVIGGVNDLIGGLLGYMRDPRRTQQMQGLAGLLESTGIPKTVERLAYNEPLTNLQQANVPALRPETANALMTLLPVPSGANRAAMAAGRAGERMAERVVPQVMERGGVPAGLLDALSTRTVSPITAYHAGPNLFDRFDVTRAPATGSAYTQGAYAAAARREAEGKYLPRAPKWEEKLMGLYKQAEKKQDYDSMEVLESALLYKNPKQLRQDFIESGEYSPEFAKKAEQTIKKIESVPRDSYLYKIDIADEALPNYLLFDKPIAEQPQAVKSFAKELGISGEDMLGGDIVGRLRSSGVSEIQIQEMMRRKGIPGLIYDSPDVQGSVNYVTYDPDLIRILEINDMPASGLLGPQQKNFQTSTSDASQIFGEGAKRIKYTDPNSGGTIDVLQKPDGTASVLGLEVPEQMRGQGIGQSLQSQVMQDFPEMMGQVSSKAAAKTAYRLGRRPPNQPDATLEDVYKIMDEYSSVNLVSPEMQKRFIQSLLD